MRKTTLTAVTVIAAAAGTAMADRPPVGPVQVETANGHAIPAVSYAGAGARSIVAEYDFATGALEVRHTSYPAQVISVDPSLANLKILAIEAVNITADVYHNQGASLENWASEIRVGLLFTDGLTESTIGAGPFAGVNSGPNTGQGTFLTFTGGEYGPFDLSNDNYFTPASGFSVSGWATFNDGTGLPASIITGGTLRVTMVPTPGAGAVLAMAGLAAIRRRRR